MHGRHPLATFAKKPCAVEAFDFAVSRRISCCTPKDEGRENQVQKILNNVESDVNEKRRVDAVLDSLSKSLSPSAKPLVTLPKLLGLALSSLEKAEKNQKRLRNQGQKVIHDIKLAITSGHRGGIRPNLQDEIPNFRILRGNRRQQEKTALRMLTRQVFNVDELTEGNIKSLNTIFPSLRVLDASARKSGYELMRKNFGPSMYNGIGALAYATARLPSTYAAIKHVMEQLKSHSGHWEPTTMLDFGAGPGTASWAVHRVWPQSKIRSTAIDSSASMADLGYKILDICYSKDSEFRKMLEISWRPFLSTKKGLISKQHDLVSAAYVLNELRDDVHIHRTLNQLIQSTKNFLILIESGTPHGFSIIEEARAYVLKVTKKLGMPFHVVAPCPHDGACPLKGKKSWCHFGQHVKRTEGQRIAIKSLTGKAPRDTQQEKFSYVILARGPRSLEKLPSHSVISDQSLVQNNPNELNRLAGRVDLRKQADGALDTHMRGPYLQELATVDPSIFGMFNGRILRPPRKRKGHVILDLCSVLDEYGASLGGNQATVIRQTVSKGKARAALGSDGAYKASRAARWGDKWPAFFQASIKNSIESPMIDNHTKYDDEITEEQLRDFFGDDAFDADEQSDEEFNPYIP